MTRSAALWATEARTILLVVGPNVILGNLDLPPQVLRAQNHPRNLCRLRDCEALRFVAMELDQLLLGGLQPSGEFGRPELQEREFSGLCQTLHQTLRDPLGHHRGLSERLGDQAPSDVLAQRCLKASLGASLRGQQFTISIAIEGPIRFEQIRLGRNGPTQGVIGNHQVLAGEVQV